MISFTIFQGRTEKPRVLMFSGKELEELEAMAGCMNPLAIIVYSSNIHQRVRDLIRMYETYEYVEVLWI